MQKTWEHARAEGHTEGRAEGRAEGRVEGRAEGRVEGITNTRAHDVLTVLQMRGIPVSAATRRRILNQKDLKQLERWLKKASVANSLEEAIGNRY
jgi:predicted transposase YdaD